MPKTSHDGVSRQQDEMDEFPQKTVPVGADKIILEDSADGDRKKYAEIVNVLAAAGVTYGQAKFVSTLGNDTTGDGSYIKPYATWQKGHDEAVALTPTADDPAFVIGLPGVYDENFIVDGDHLRFIGLGGKQGCAVVPTSGPAMIVTNATRASVATFLTNGGHADPGAHYTDLSAHPSNMPTDLKFSNMAFGKVSGSGYDVMNLGVGNDIAFGESGLVYSGCWISNDTFGRTVNLWYLQDNTWVAVDIDAYNVALTYIENSYSKGYEGNYNAGSDQPSYGVLGFTYGLCGNNANIAGTIKAEGTDKVGGDTMGLRNSYINGNVDLDDSSNCYIVNSQIKGNVDAEQNATFLFEGVYVKGTVTIASGGTGTARWDGGGWIGALTDSGNKLVYNELPTGKGSVSDTEASTTGTTYIQKLRHTFTPPAAGDYEIEWSCMVSASATKVPMITRLQVDDTDTYDEGGEDLAGDVYSDGIYVHRTGKFVASLSAASHDIDLDFKSGKIGKTVYIKLAKITHRRVA